MVKAFLLGIAQDAGLPQAGCTCANCVAAWHDPALRRHAVCLGVLDHDSNQWFLLDASPSFPLQYHRMGDVAGDATFGGIFITHIHIGHYSGLLHLGREVMATRLVPTYATASARDFLTRHEPWAALTGAGNIDVRLMVPGDVIRLSPSLAITPLSVPHRGEFSDTVAFVVQGRDRRLLYLPDIDRWEAWDRDIRDFVSEFDVALLDATFFDADELPSRSMKDVPHPLVVDTLALLAGTTCDVRLIHLNHTNPLHRNGPERGAVVRAGLDVGREGDQWAL